MRGCATFDSFQANHKESDRQERKNEIAVYIPRYRTSQSVFTVYNAVRQSSRVFVKLFGQNTRGAETTRNENESHACGGCSLARRRKKILCRELHSTQMRKPENGGMGKKGLEGCSMGASLGGKGYDSGGVGCDGDIMWWCECNQLIGSSVSGKSGDRLKNVSVPDQRHNFSIMTAKGRLLAYSPQIHNSTRLGNTRDRFPWFPARFSSSLAPFTIKRKDEGSKAHYSMCHTSSGLTLIGSTLGCRGRLLPRAA